MGRQTLTLGRFYDIRVGVHISWFVVYAFMTIALARGLGMLPTAAAFAFAGTCALALFASVVAHELAHAFVARRFGVRTGTITLFLFGGIATLEDEPPTPRADAAIALSGPLVSGLLAILFLALAFAIDRYVPLVAHDLGRLATYVALANAVLAIFNAIPAYPLDGGRVLRAVLWRTTRDRRRATVIAARIGMSFAVVFIAAAVLIVAATHEVLYGWYAVLGAFLLRQGWAQERADTIAARANAAAGAAA